MSEHNEIKIPESLVKGDLKNYITIEDGQICLNMGPHHPSTHGVMRLIIRTDGEVIKSAVPDIGYLHRGLEKIGEITTYQCYMPYTDRLDYLGSMFCNHVYAMAVEKLLGIEVPKRAEYLRVIADELNRIISHLIYLGCLSLDLGAYTPFVQAIREREIVNDIIEKICGARITYNYCRFGGVSFDMPFGVREELLNFCDHFEPIVDELNRLITYNEIFVKRCANVAIVSAEDAIGYGWVGPNLRASGVDFDVRRDVPYSIYPEIEFKPCVGKGERGTVGDTYDRLLVRIGEMLESTKIVRQCVQKIPVGPIQGKVPKKLKPEKGSESTARVESVRGDLLCYLVSDGSEKPFRMHFRTGSFNAMGFIEKISPGLMVADLVAFFASLDVVAPETDR